jgi:hypothetical protein
MNVTPSSVVEKNNLFPPFPLFLLIRLTKIEKTWAQIKIKNCRTGRGKGMASSYSSSIPRPN